MLPWILASNWIRYVLGLSLCPRRHTVYSMIAAWLSFCFLINVKHGRILAQSRTHILNNPLLDLGIGHLSLCFDLVSEDGVTAIDSQDNMNKIGIVQTHPSNKPRDFVHGHIETAQNPGSLKILKLCSSIASVYHKILCIPNPTARQVKSSESS